jgi:hypothetical protein
MKSWKKVRPILMVALFATLAGTSFAAAPAPSFSAADTPSQAQEPPVDCKKKPDDPRCRNKPY